MAAGINDHFTEATNGTRPVPTVLNSIKSIGAGSLSANALTGWATNTAVHFILYNIDTSNNKIAGTQSDWKGIVSGTSITGLVLKAGNDANYGIGTVVEAAPTAAWANDAMDGILIEHLQSGTHGAITPTSVQSAGVINTATQGNLQDGAISLPTYRQDFFFDFIKGGTGVITGDAYGSTLNASMTAATWYQNGTRLTQAAVNGRAYTANKDTYVDLLNTAGVSSVVYTEVANNAASPALAANSVRLAIIISGATNILNAGSVNQGQETMVLPIASSVAYSVTDSLGNLICPRDPNRKILGYRQTTTTATATSGAGVAAWGALLCPVIVPTGRKIKITVHTPQVTSSGTSAVVYTSVWNGTVGSGTQLQEDFLQNAGANQGASGETKAYQTPSTATANYQPGLRAISGGGVWNCGALDPASITVELD